MAELIRTALANDWPVQWYDEIDSTNTECSRRAARDEFSPTWIVAEKQSAGRGRRGRTWSSQAGNLHTSAFFPFDMSMAEASKVPFCVGLAIIDAAKGCGINTQNFKLKWPNDVRVDKRKLSGSLIETGPISKNTIWMAVGVGVNVSTKPEVDQHTCCLNDFASNDLISVEQFFNNFRKTFKHRLEILVTSGFLTIRQDWLNVAEGVNQSMSVTEGTEIYNGVMRGIDINGAIQLEMHDGRVKSCVAGDLDFI